MKAVLIERPHEVAYVDLDRPAAGVGEVVVRSHVAGVCRTDLEMLHGGLTDPRWVRFPLVPGHEWSGSVVELGEGVDDLAVGERVVCEGMIPCNRCRRCKEGETQLCLNYDQIGFTRSGGYAEFVAVPRHVVHRLPDAVSFAAGVLVEPAACVVRGIERARPRPGDTVGVIGIGTLGSLALTLARLYAPGALIAYGVRREELQFASILGADAVVHVSEED
ncbi:MAG TPA: alcohol dehydrogenase catalytic domain-containing protein, partial [Gaiellaceae bacterium]